MMYLLVKRIQLTMVLLGATGMTLLAQDFPPMPVRYTEAQPFVIEQKIQLTGNVGVRHHSLVASTVGGIVAEIPVEAGDKVTRGQVLARLDTTTTKLLLRSAEAGLNEAEARLNLAKAEVERVRNLFEKNIATAQDLDRSNFEWQAWQGTRAKLKADSDLMADRLRRSTIRAPFDGVVTARHVDLGTWVSEGGSVAEVISLDKMEVVVQVPERYFPLLTSESAATVSFASLPGTTMRSKGISIIPSQSGTSRTFPVKVYLEPSHVVLPQGMLAKVTFKFGDGGTSVLVPKDAVVIQSQQSFVYRILDDKTVTQVPVEPGRAIGQWIEIQAGVAAGEHIVTRGNERVMAGMVVNPEPLEYELPSHD